MNMTRMARTAFGLLALTLIASVSCSSDDESTVDTTTTAGETTTTAEIGTTAAPTAEGLVYPVDHTARITVEPTEVTAGDVVAVSVTGFAPGASLSSAFLAKWPPTEIPDADHMVTLKPDAAVVDDSGAATLEVTIDPVCGQGDCYLVVAEGIGADGIYAGVKMNYRG
jgi:hypothetical protein